MAGLVGIWYRKLSKAVSVLIVGEIKKQGDENGNKEATEKRKKFKKNIKMKGSKELNKWEKNIKGNKVIYRVFHDFRT